VDIETLVAEDATIAIDKTYLGLGGNNPLEPRLCNCHVSPLFPSIPPHRHSRMSVLAV
jgi:hypothetical protein